MAVRSTPNFLRVHAFGRTGSVEAVSRSDIIIRKSGAEPIRQKLYGDDSVRLNLEALSTQTMEQRRDEVLALIRS